MLISISKCLFLGTFLSLSCTTSAYVIDVYHEYGCTGKNEVINVWDGTCATLAWSARSVILKEYGHTKELFTSYQDKSCLAQLEGPKWADRDNEEFFIDGCMDLPDSAHSLGSRKGF